MWNHVWYLHGFDRFVLIMKHILPPCAGTYRLAGVLSETSWFVSFCLPKWWTTCYSFVRTYILYLSLKGRHVGTGKWHGPDNWYRNWRLPYLLLDTWVWVRHSGLVDWLSRFTGVTQSWSEGVDSESFILKGGWGALTSRTCITVCVSECQNRNK